MQFNVNDESCYLTKDNLSLEKNASLVFFYKLVGMFDEIYRIHEQEICRVRHYTFFMVYDP